jgi:hypothetical protein
MAVRALVDCDPPAQHAGSSLFAQQQCRTGDAIGIDQLDRGLGWATFFFLEDLPDSLRRGHVADCGTTSQHCRPRAAVALEPSLQRTSPQNGNIRVFSWRLSAIPVVEAGKVGTWRLTLMRENPAVSGLFSSFVGNLVGRRTGWLATQC